MAEHRMGRSPLNHGDGGWCEKCKATDREITFALGPVCPVEDTTPVRMLVDAEWLSRTVETDPDVDTDAGRAALEQGA